MNGVMISGLVCAVRQMRFTDSGVAILEFAIGATDRVITHSGVTQVGFYQWIKAVGQVARQSGGLVRGAFVSVSGQLHHFRDRELDVLEIIAERITPTGELATIQDGAFSRSAFGFNKAWLSGTVEGVVTVQRLRSGRFAASALMAVTDEEGRHLVPLVAWDSLEFASLASGASIQVEARLYTELVGSERLLRAEVLDFLRLHPQGFSSRVLTGGTTAIQGLEALDQMLEVSGPEESQEDQWRVEMEVEAYETE